ncbi:5'-nucleotidase [compost metagenome]
MFTILRYNHFLFDLDGTLTDPAPGITKSVQYALSKLDINEQDLTKLQSFIGPPLQETFSKHYEFDQTTTWQAIEYYREYFKEKGLYENEVYNGITDLLSLLKSKEKKIYVATSKPLVFASEILRHFKLDHYFTGVFGSELDGTRSDKKELIGYMLETLQLNRLQTVMIGDRKHDILGAHHNQIHSVGVGYGYGSKEELLGAQPTYYYETLDELIQACLVAL